jgi:selenide,water dikinase
LSHLPAISDPAVLVGTSTSDDAAAFRLDDQQAILQTLDFITPIVDDPYDYGQIAAANSISDIYAMGGRPLFALNIVCFPSKKIPLEVLGRILQGGADKAREAGIPIVGGHSVEDAEPKYGLVVTGIAPPARILTNAGAKPGDVLILTKPLGSGILSSAWKREKLSPTGQQTVTRTMATLNRAAAESLDGLAVHALTDVTGFGLVGHLSEMMAGSQTTARISAGKVPLLDEVWTLAAAGVYPGGAKRNLDQFGSRVTWPTGSDDVLKVVLADPQTSGGLLIAVAAEDAPRLVERLQAAKTLAAAVIGEVVASTGALIDVIP